MPDEDTSFILIEFSFKDGTSSDYYYLIKNTRPVILFLMLKFSISFDRCTPNTRVISAEKSNVDEFRSGHEAALYPRIEHSIPSEMYSLTASPSSVHLHI